MDWKSVLGSVIVGACAALVVREVAAGGTNWDVVVPILLAAVVGRLIAHRARRPAPAWLERRMPSKNPDDYR